MFEESTTMYCGYIINEAFLAHIARENHLPLVFGALARAKRLLEACDLFIGQTPMGTRARAVGVCTTSGRLRACIALASNDAGTLLPRHPRPEDIATFKALLEIDEEPRWSSAFGRAYP